MSLAVWGKKFWPEQHQFTQARLFKAVHGVHTLVRQSTVCDEHPHRDSTDQVRIMEKIA